MKINFSIKLIMICVLSLLAINAIFYKDAGAAVDKSKPVLKKVTLSKTEVYEEDKIILKANVSDIGSGVNQVIMNYTLPKSQKNFKVVLKKKSNTEFQGEILITKTSEIGGWNPLSIIVSDKAGNINTYYNQYNNLNKNRYNNKNLSIYIINVKSITNTNVTVNKVSDNSTQITGTAKSNSIVYAVVSNKIIGTGKTVNGKFKVNILPQKVGKTITIYSNFKGALSKKINIIVMPNNETIDYYNPEIVTKIKLGEMNTLFGLSLNEKFKNYSNVTRDQNEDYNDNKFYEYAKDNSPKTESLSFMNDTDSNYFYAIFDFPDNPMKTPEINRIVHSGIKFSKKFERKYMHNLYGKPSADNIYVTNDSENTIIDFYDNVTFIYEQDSLNGKVYLSDVVYLGELLKSNPDIWKSYVKQYYTSWSYLVTLYSITQDKWDELA